MKHRQSLNIARVLCTYTAGHGWGTFCFHYSDVIMGPTASQITSLTIVFSAVYSDAVQRKHQSSASLAFVRGIHRGPVNSPHKWPVTRKMFPFDDVIMLGHKSGTILWLVCYYRFCELLSAFVWEYTGIFRFNPNMQNTALQLINHKQYFKPYRVKQG